MKFEAGCTHRGGLSQAEAAEVLGARTFRRWRDRYEAPTVATTAAWAASRRGARRWTRWRGAGQLFDWDFTAKHFHRWWPITASSAATTGCG